MRPIWYFVTSTRVLIWLGVRHVKDKGDGAAAEGADFFGDGLGVLPADLSLVLRHGVRLAAGAGDNDIRAVARQGERDVAADPAIAPGAGDDRDLAVEVSQPWRP